MNFKAQNSKYLYPVRKLQHSCWGGMVEIENINSLLRAGSKPRPF